MANIFSLTLEGAQEAPTPVTTTASGTGTVVWDETNNTAAYVVTVTGLDFGDVLGIDPQTPSPDDDVTNMHVHNEVRGQAGGVVFGQIAPPHDDDDLRIVLNADGSTTVSGIWETTDPANVSITTFASELTSATTGSDVALYFNVHTEANPTGEIRAQWVAIGGREDGTSGNDTIAAPAGEALLAFARGGDDSVDGGGLTDSLNGGIGDDTIDGLDGDDTLSGGPGADYIEGGLGNDSLWGGLGFDTLIGQDGDDTAFGGLGDDELWGAGGNDSLGGGIGDDLLDGDEGDDVMGGGAGADQIEGDEGADTLDGGLGADVFLYEGDEQTGEDLIADYEPGTDLVRMVAFLAGFDPLANLSADPDGVVLDLGGGNSVLFAGLALGDLTADDFMLG